MAFSGGSVVKNLPAMKRCRFSLWVGKISWRREWQLSPVFLPGEFHGQRSLEGYSPWGHKESDMTEQLNFCFLFTSFYAYKLTNIHFTCEHDSLLAAVKATNTHLLGDNSCKQDWLDHDHFLHWCLCVSHSVMLFVIPWTVACQAPLSMEFSR